jgi:flagellar protein FlaG
MILFIASILVAASVVGVFTDSITRVSSAIDDRGVSVSDNVRTDFEIISDSGSTRVYQENGGANGQDVIVLHAKNTGSKRLRAEREQIDVIVNGRYTANLTVALEAGEDPNTWGRSEVVRITINRSLSLGDHRVKIIANEDEEVFRFRV